MPIHDTVVPGLRLLMSDLIDYAGLFPPARLSLEDAADRYARYSQGDDAWMLGRFIIPASGLGDLEKRNDFFDAERRPRLSVILKSEDESGNVLDNLRTGVGLVARFSDGRAGRAQIDSLEMPWPTGIDERDDIRSVVSEIRSLVDHTLDRRVRIFVETSWKQESAELLSDVALALAAENHDRLAFGLKLRSGGLTPDLVPGVDELSAFIRTAHRAGVPFKATAGLHHPVRNEDTHVGATMFGFMNVFVGAMLVNAGSIEPDSLADVLTEDDASSFSFDDGIAWRDHRMSQGEIRAGRAFAVSFGSCSFDEPRDDLRSLGLL